MTPTKSIFDFMTLIFELLSLCSFSLTECIQNYQHGESAKPWHYVFDINLNHLSHVLVI